MNEILKDQKLIAIAILFLALFNFPLLSIFNKGQTLFHIPVIYLYVFCCWLLIITCIAFIMERNTKNTDENE